MASVCAVCVLNPVPADALARLGAVGLRLANAVGHDGHLWIDVPLDGTPVDELARKISRVLDATVFAFLGQRTSDTFQVTECAKGQLVSQVTGLEGEWEFLGLERPWHTHPLFQGTDVAFDELQQLMGTFLEASGTRGALTKR